MELFRPLLTHMQCSILVLFLKTKLIAFENNCIDNVTSGRCQLKLFFLYERQLNDLQHPVFNVSESDI